MDYADLLTQIAACADEVAREWGTDSVEDRVRITDPLESRLATAGVLEAFPTLLGEAAELLGDDLAADPVAAPPYVLVTSVGPVARATLARRPVRLVVEIRVFEVRPEAGGYRRSATTIGESLRVRLRNTR